MKLTAVYECLRDPTRMRILRALAEGPLCVCHLQEVLGEPQVKISKHLAYLKSHEAVAVKRSGSWMIYAVPAKANAALRANLDLLLAAEQDPMFRDDAKRLTRLRKSFPEGAPVCPPAPAHH